MRILLTGSNGFLGQKITDFVTGNADITLLCTSASPNRNPNKDGYEFVQVDFQDLDKLKSLIKDFKPTHIIHSAAISHVDTCEQDPALCQWVNVTTTGELAKLCAEDNIHLTFLSTDFVFDGEEGPYHEDDACNPCNAYGKSKLDAERLIADSGCRYVILRTILVYGVHADRNRSNIVLWAKQQLEIQETIRVVQDQWRMPTWVDDLANATIKAAKSNAEGIFHISGKEMMSIFEIAQRVARHWQLDDTLITPIRAEDIGQHKNRPKKTGFYLDKAKEILGYSPTPFEKTLTEIEKQFNIYRS